MFITQIQISTASSIKDGSADTNFPKTLLVGTNKNEIPENNENANPNIDPTFKIFPPTIVMGTDESSDTNTPPETLPTITSIAQNSVQRFIPTDILIDLIKSKKRYSMDEINIFLERDDIKKIINSHGSNGDTPLSVAISLNQKYVVKKLIKKGADVNMDVLSDVLGENVMCSPLGIAIIKGYKEIVNELVEEKAYF
jgi:hypothetical protein